MRAVLAVGAVVAAIVLAPALWSHQSRTGGCTTGSSVQFPAALGSGGFQVPIAASREAATPYLSSHTPFVIRADEVCASGWFSVDWSAAALSSAAGRALFAGFSARPCQGSTNHAFFSAFPDFELGRVSACDASWRNHTSNDTLATLHDSLQSPGQKSGAMRVGFVKTTVARLPRRYRHAIRDNCMCVESRGDAKSGQPRLGLARCPVNGPADNDVWLATRGQVSYPHYDLQHNLYTQLSGTKTFVLAPPEAMARLPVFSSLHPRHRQLLSRHMWRDLQGKGMERYSVTLLPGDTLYIPPMWLHSGFARTPSASLSTVTPHAGVVLDTLRRMPLPVDTNWGAGSVIVTLVAVVDAVSDLVTDLRHGGRSLVGAEVRTRWAGVRSVCTGDVGSGSCPSIAGGDWQRLCTASMPMRDTDMQHGDDDDALERPHTWEGMLRRAWETRSLRPPGITSVADWRERVAHRARRVAVVLEELMPPGCRVGQRSELCRVASQAASIAVLVANLVEEWLWFLARMVLEGMFPAADVTDECIMNAVLLIVESCWS